MSQTRCRAVALAALACAAMLAACDDAPTQQGAPSSTKPNAAAPKVAQLSTQMVAAVSAGKTATAIGVHFALGSVPTVGKDLPVKIAIVPHRDFASLGAHFDSRDGLTLTTGENFGPVAAVDSESPLQHDLILLPQKEGVFMVTISVDTDGEDGNFTRIFTIPVIVGMGHGEPAASAPASAASARPPQSATH
ncbi:MAG: hypothetical protein ABI769_19690 [Pseudomonadota bacterium]